MSDSPYTWGWLPLPGAYRARDEPILSIKPRRVEKVPHGNAVLEKLWLSDGFADKWGIPLAGVTTICCGRAAFGLGYG